MAEKPVNKPAAQSNIEVGGNVGGNIILGNNNIINMTPEQQVFRSLHQLPPAPADFTGREELIAQLIADFEKGKGATITGQPIQGLTGMGGIGKTALGLVVAHQTMKDYPDAQIFLDLKGVTTPLSAIEVMRHVILSFEPTIDLRTLDEANLSATYHSVLGGKKALLFLDNARSAEQIAPLRPPETCAMLVTSRWTFSVPGLRTHRVGVMNEGDAKDFLLELCPRIGDAEHAAAELAKACAYMPLALRIAGSFLQVNGDWGVEKYLTILNDRKHRLATFEQSREDAELTAEPDLLATFELSYSQLAEESRKRWRMLAVFPTSFDVSAAGAMWDLDEDTTRKLLGSLCRYSLLDYHEISSRYGLHDLLGDYALSQMQNGEEQEARLKHASHYKSVLSMADGLYLEGGEKVLMGLRLFDLEWENIRTGQAWAASVEGNNRAITELCIAYLFAGTYVLDLRLHPRELIHWLEGAISAAREIGDRPHEAFVLRKLGTAYQALGEARKSIALYEQALVIMREIGDRRDEGVALANLGAAYQVLGEARKAIALYEQALVIDREIGNRRNEGHVLGSLGFAYYSLGEARKAIEFHEQALDIDREIGNRRNEANALSALGLAYADLGEARKAIALYEQALVINREIGDRNGEANTLDNLGLAYAALGEARKAVEVYEQALVIDREIGNHRDEGYVLGNLGLAYADLGEVRKAIELYERALVILREIGDRRPEAAILDSLASAYVALGEARRAIALCEQALVILREIGDRRGEGFVSWTLGLAYEKAGELSKAIEAMQILADFEREIRHPDAEKHAVYVEELRKKLEEGGQKDAE
jgi:tetratricopeptide (TPR) repeat protein